MLEIDNILKMKTSGYPTLQSIFWTYLTMYEDVGINNNNFSYQNMLQYIGGIGNYWVDLVSQFVPATTLWNSGTKLENSPFHRQKFIYRRQKGCESITEYQTPPAVGAPLFFPFGTNESENPPSGGGGGGGDIKDPPAGCQFEQTKERTLNCPQDFTTAYDNFYTQSINDAIDNNSCGLGPKTNINVTNWIYGISIIIYEFDANGDVIHEYPWESLTYGLSIKQSEDTPYSQDYYNTNGSVIDCDVVYNSLSGTFKENIVDNLSEIGYEYNFDYDIETGSVTIIINTQNCLDFTFDVLISVKGVWECASGK